MSGLVATVDELITEIISLSDDKSPWLIVEGESDVLFFEQRFLKYNISYEDRQGWDGVLNLMKAWNLLNVEERKDRILVGVIDRDYHDLLETDIPPNVVVADDRDIEISMFESDEALNKVLLEYGSREKLPIVNNKIDLSKVRATVYNLTYPLTKLRFFNATNSSLCLKFEKPFDFRSIIGLKPLSFDEARLIHKISIHNGCQKEVLQDILNQEIDSTWNEHKKIANGHDVICVLGKCLQKHFGSISESKFVEGSKLEGSFRLAYSNDEFERSNFGSKIIDLLKLNNVSEKAA